MIRLLAGKLFGISDKKIIVGNGAAELIREMMQETNGKIGFVTPTFEEYINCCKQEQRVIMDTRKMDFHILDRTFRIILNRSIFKCLC